LAQSLEVRLRVETLAVRPGPNLQARARDARLGALQNAAEREGAACIAFGHTADDRAETFLLRLLRGSGPRGLAVLPARASAPVAAASGRSVPIVRPLINAHKQDVLDHLLRHEIGYALDPSNEDPRFVRVRVRRELLPLLQELSPRIVEHLCALAGMLEHTSARAGPDPLARLGRAQRIAIERAIALGKRRLRLKIRGGGELEVRIVDGAPVLGPES